MNGSPSISRYARPLVITTQCSASCDHCLFANGAGAGQFISVQKVAQICAQAEQDVFVLTGGEPLDHPRLDQIVEVMEQSGRYFRIATGGHRPVATILSQLKKSPHCLGLSMGTDILAHGDSQAVVNWWTNIYQLVRQNYPFSLTITQTRHLDAIVAKLLARRVALDHCEFLYLRLRKGQSLQARLTTQFEAAGFKELIQRSVWEHI